MVPVEVFGIFAVVADKKLRTSGVFSGVRHGKNATIVILVVAAGFAWNGITWSAGSGSVGAATLDNKIWYYPVKSQSIVKTIFCKFYEVRHCNWRIGIIKINFHYSFCGMDGCFCSLCHDLKFLFRRKSKKIRQILFVYVVVFGIES
jgi:hypothetical protein